MRVMKFGGTSVRNAEALQAVARIVGEQTKQDPEAVVVLSATSGTTNALLTLARIAASGRNFDAEFNALEQHHMGIARDLGISSATTEVFLQECREHLEAAAILGECTPQTYDAIAGYGELLSTSLFAVYLAVTGVDAAWVDARRCIITDDNFQSAGVDLDRTIAATKECITPRIQDGGIVVTQGFVGATQTGIPTTLGRGGSDYSAALIGRCLGASEIQIWTDVSGVYTCDPRIVPTAKPLASISFDDIRTLAHYGAKVLHPETVEPAIAAGIPVHVLNTFDAEAPGTIIQADDTTNHPITALSLIRPCRRIHTDDAGTHALTSIDLINENIAFSIKTRNGNTVVVHEQAENISMAIDVAAVGHTFDMQNVACIALCGTQVNDPTILSQIADCLRQFPSCTLTSLVSPRCILVTVRLDEAIDACSALHSLLVSSSSSSDS